MRARLDVVQGDLDHELGLDVNRIAIGSNGELLQLGGLPDQHLIGHAFEGLAQHHELAGARADC